MAIDFQVVFPNEVVKTTSVSLIPNSNPQMVGIVGDDFRSVDEVLINDIASPNVIILSRTRLLAQLPESVTVGATPIRILVTSRKLTITPKSLIRFRVGRTPSKVRGILRLVQVFLKILFTTPGSDIFSPKLGAGALKNLGKTFGKDQTGAIVSDFVVAVDVTSRQIIGIQGRDPSLPSDERLLSAKVKAANFDSGQAALVVSVEITSQAGVAAQTNLVV